MEEKMQEDVTYNQIICLTNEFLNFHTVKKSFSEKRKLILIFEDSKKIVIPGNNIDTSGNRKRISELISMAEEKGLYIPKNSVKHYAKKEGNEYVLVRW